MSESTQSYIERKLPGAQVSIYTKGTDQVVQVIKGSGQFNILHHVDGSLSVVDAASGDYAKDLFDTEIDAADYVVRSLS